MERPYAVCPGNDKGYMSEKKYETFNIIRFRGTPKSATLQKGEKVYRVEKIYAPGFADQVGPNHDLWFPCTDYTGHFIYEAPDSYMGPKHRCTCGSMSVLTGPSGYSWGASNTNLMFVCHAHVSTGRHADGSS